jgi:5-hydroxyisourate hydrolase
MKSFITTHVLDTANGHPAAGIPVTLEKRENGEWKSLAKGTTNDDGRITDWIPAEKSASTGVYRVIFEVENYLRSHTDKEVFYSRIPVVFHLNDASVHHHIPLLLSPFGYSTYKGS